MLVAGLPSVWWGGEQSLVEPMAVWLAADGDTLTEVGEFWLGSPLAEGFWIGQPAMSSNAVVIPIYTNYPFDSVDESTSSEQSWLLVGRLLAP